MATRPTLPVAEAETESERITSIFSSFEEDELFWNDDLVSVVFEELSALKEPVEALSIQTQQVDSGFLFFWLSEDSICFSCLEKKTPFFFLCCIPVEENSPMDTTWLVAGGSISSLP
jgi:hypothetical protein